MPKGLCYTILKNIFILNKTLSTCIIRAALYCTDVSEKEDTEQNWSTSTINHNEVNLNVIVPSGVIRPQTYQLPWEELKKEKRKCSVMSDFLRDERISDHYWQIWSKPSLTKDNVHKIPSLKRDQYNSQCYLFQTLSGLHCPLLCWWYFDFFFDISLTTVRTISRSLPAFLVTSTPPWLI